MSLCGLLRAAINDAFNFKVLRLDYMIEDELRKTIYSNLEWPLTIALYYKVDGTLSYQLQEDLT